MQIAVITPARNIAAFIGDAVRSVLRQTHRDWRLVVVDDGSTDGTPEVVAGFSDQRIRLVRQAGAGVSAARNRGIALAGPADAMLFLDGDDWLAPTGLADLAATLAGHPAAVAASGRYARVGIDGFVRRSAAPQAGDILTRLLRRNLFANGGHVLIAARGVRAAGPFRTDLQYGEDWEYWTRLALHGPFAVLRRRHPVLFVRERRNGVCYAQSADPDRYAVALDAIHANPRVVARVGARGLRSLRRAGDAEIAWAVGRELIRHRRTLAGQRQLCRSLLAAPSPKRLLMTATAWSGCGPFRRYRETN